MTTEQRLRDALHAEAEAVRPRDAEWATIETRGASRQRTRRLIFRGAPVVFATAAAIVVITGMTPLFDGRDERPNSVIVGGQPDSTVPTTTVPATTVPTTQGRAVWNRSFPTSAEAARGFATEYLGMASPVVVPAATESQHLVRAVTGRGAFTRVSTVFENGAWFVTGAWSDNLHLDSPVAYGFAQSPVELRGRSRAFEAHVNVEIREFDQVAGQSLASTFFTGGGGGMDLEPFTTTVTFRAPTRFMEYGAIVLLTYSAEDGRVVEATVVPVRFTVE